MLASNKRENAGLNAGSPENWFHLGSLSFKQGITKYLVFVFLIHA
jgi:hypothetical protein